jgi:8-oxo-dGTP pyrophosphatase MutT (NUDIX family)
MNNGPKAPAGQIPTDDRAAAICYRPKGETIEFLLVRSHGGGWIFPKGHIEAGEKAWQAAEREAFEEAGASGGIRRERLTTFLLVRQDNKNSAPGGVCRVAAFALLVKDIQPAQEKDRDPAWFSAWEAKEALGLYRQGKDARELERVVRLAVVALGH